MRCSKCGTDNPEGLKFCNECAAPFGRRCSKCGFENLPAAKFCGECAAPLNASASRPPSQASAEAVRITAGADSQTIVDGERKTVTALFADIKGSMELMEDLDPEEARAIIDPALHLMIEAVRRYDGYIVQSTGDGIFALFGAPLAHEDHPQRALYAALRMQEEIKRFAERLRAEKGLNLQVRVGANSGEVVVRSIETGQHAEYTPIGHSTSLASRLQALASPGSIAISEGLRKLVEGYFTLKALGPARIKGTSEPVNVYEVTGIGPLRTRLQRSAGRGLTKFVGREREMEALKHAAEQAKAGHGQIVAAMAEPGVGKSRLFFEFKATSQSGWMVLETFSVSPGKASAYLPVIDLLRNYFDITTTDDERKRREKVAGKITILDRSLEDTSPYLFGLLGIVEGDDPLAQMDGQIKKRRTLEAIKRIILRESLNQPLMVMFEDLHWIDEQTQEMLNLLADSIGTAKILLLVNYRPEYSHPWGNKTYYTQLRLDPLGKESADEMLSALLGTSPAPATQSPGASRERPAGDLQVAGRVRAQDSIEGLKRLIIERTEGNPFFMEETVQVLLDEGALVRDGAAVRLTKPLGELKIPPTVQAVLAARIDRLPLDEKELLQTLSVIGREFPLGLVRRVWQHPHPRGTALAEQQPSAAPPALSRNQAGEGQSELEGMLANLQMAEFVYEQPVTGDVEYVFKHALTQEVAYNSVLVERRKLLHERAGQALESMFAEQLDDHLGDLAHHYSRSDNVAKAVEYLGRAGQQAMQRSVYPDAISHLTTATDLLRRLPNSPERIQRELLLRMAVGPALIAVRGYAAPEVELAYTRMRELCEQLGDPPEFSSALYGLWFMHLFRGELRSAYELAQQLLLRAQRMSDQTLLLLAEVALGINLFWLGEFLPAREHLEIAISIYNPARHRSLALLYGGADAGVYCLSQAAFTLWVLGYPDQALKRGNQAIALAQELSHPYSLAFAKNLSALRTNFGGKQVQLRSMRRAS